MNTFVNSGFSGSVFVKGGIELVYTDANGEVCWLYSHMKAV
jgi:hypothetical protein